MGTEYTDGLTQPPQMAGTVGAEMVRGVVAAAEALGVDRHELLAAMDCPEASLTEEGGRLPGAAFDRAWVYLAKHADGGCIGARVADKIGQASESWVVQLALLSRTLEEALLALLRFFQLLSEGERVITRSRAEGFEIEFVARSLAPMPQRELYEFALGRMVVFARQVVGGSLTPLRVSLMRSRTHDQVLTRLFGSNIVFEEPRYAVLLSREDIGRLSVNAQPKLRKLVEEHVELLAEHLPKRQGTVPRVQREILSLLPLGRASLAHVARACGTSARTLQRRLADEGTTFAVALDDVRYALAREMLNRSDYSIGRVACELGFSTHAAFHAAFCRWSGQTPGQFRGK